MFRKADNNDLKEMVRAVSKQTLCELEFKVTFENTIIFKELLNLLPEKLNDATYKELQPKLSDWLKKEGISDSLKDNILAFCNEAVNLIEGRGSQIDLALSLFDRSIDELLSFWKATISDVDYSKMEKFLRTPEQELVNLISEDVIQYIHKIKETYKTSNYPYAEELYSSSYKTMIKNLNEEFLAYSNEAKAKKQLECQNQVPTEKDFPHNTQENQIYDNILESSKGLKTNNKLKYKNEVTTGNSSLSVI